MVKKTLWLLISCLMVLSLVIASCGDGGEEEEEEEEQPEKVETGYDSPTEPKYGGTFTRIATGDYRTIDYAAGRDMFTPMLMGEEMLMYGVYRFWSGSKYRGKTLNEVPLKELDSYLGFLEDLDCKSISVRYAIKAITEYLNRPSVVEELERLLDEGI